MTRADFIAAILHAPGDDVLRLVFADWLEEQGEDASAVMLRLPGHWQVSLAGIIWRDQLSNTIKVGNCKRPRCARCGRIRETHYLAGRWLCWMCQALGTHYLPYVGATLQESTHATT